MWNFEFKFHLLEVNDQIFLEALKKIYHQVSTAPDNLNKEGVRLLSCNLTKEAFSHVNFQILGSENLPYKSNCIFIYNFSRKINFFLSSSQKMMVWFMLIKNKIFHSIWKKQPESDLERVRLILVPITLARPKTSFKSWEKFLIQVHEGVNI